MKTQKIKRYRLGVSRTFPTTHPRNELTYFKQKIELALMKQENPNLEIKAQYPNGVELEPKIHTIRANHQLWAKRMAEVQAGRAVIELFYWSEKPYKSKQIVFATLDNDSGCGVQKLDLIFGIEKPWVINENKISIETNRLAKNDGLSLDDFKAWFKGYDLSKPMAIIHFTKLRY